MSCSAYTEKKKIHICSFDIHMSQDINGVLCSVVVVSHTGVTRKYLYKKKWRNGIVSCAA